MIDGGGAGGSGADFYVGTHDDYVVAYPDDNTAQAHPSSGAGEMVQIAMTRLSAERAPPADHRLVAQ